MKEHLAEDATYLCLIVETLFDSLTWHLNLVVRLSVALVYLDIRRHLKLGAWFVCLIWNLLSYYILADKDKDITFQHADILVQRRVSWFGWCITVVEQCQQKTVGIFLHKNVTLQMQSLHQNDTKKQSFSNLTVS